MKPHVSQELLFAYFAGQATPFQKQLIEEWARQSDNREQFFAWLATYESQHPQYLPEVSRALERHWQRMAQPTAEVPGPAEAVRMLNSRRWLGWLAAASVSLLLGGWLGRDQLLNQTYRTAYGETRTLTLADGSLVTLNSNSTLTLPRFGFGRDTRDVVLAGEAAFSVQHTPDHKRFVVKTDRRFEVVVLGTEFVVYNRQQGGRVVLSRGRVQLRYRDGATTHQLLMKPGDQVTVNQQGTPQLRQLPKPENVLAWRDNRYVFDETPLYEIAQLFSDNYGLHLHFADATLATWTVSGSFTARTADELLETLMEASSLTYTRTANRVIIASPTNE